MFIENKFTTWYYQLIDRANSRTVDPNQYYETHHIIPRCMGGSDAKSNLVRFTAREHYIAHMLLVRMTTGPAKRKMSFGLWKMISANKVQNRYMPCNRQYEIIKRNMAQAISEQNTGKTWEEIYGADRASEIKEEYKVGKRVPWNKGKTGIYSEESLNKMRKKKKPTMLSANVRQKISESLKMYNKNKIKDDKTQKRPRIRFILENLTTKDLVETTNLRKWCQQMGFFDARLYAGKTDWKIVAKYSLKTGELIK